MKVVHWTIKAKERLHDIQEHIAIDNLTAALKMVEAILDKADQTGPLPLLGKMVPDYQRKDVRELGEHPYRIIYRVKEDQIDILTVKHVRQRLPKIIRKL